MVTIPVELIAEHLPIYLRRTDWNNLSLVNRECQQHMTIHDNAPWPNDDFVLDVGRDVEDGVRPTQGERHEIAFLAVSPHNGGEWIACICNDGTIRLWDRRTGRRKVIPPDEDAVEEVTQVLFHPTNPNMLIAFEYHGNILVFDDIRTEPVPTHRIFPLDPDYDYPTAEVTVSPDGERMATAATHIPSQKRHILIYSLKDDCPVLRCWNHDGDDVESLIFDPRCKNGMYLASLQWMDCKISIWDLENMDETESGNGNNSHPLMNALVGFPGCPIWTMKCTASHASGNFDNDSMPLLASISHNGRTLILWDVVKKTSSKVLPLASLSPEDDTDEDFVVAHANMNHHGNIVAAGRCDGTIELWNMDNKGLHMVTISSPKDHFQVNDEEDPNSYADLHFTPDCRTIIAADNLTGHIYFRFVPI